MEYREEMLIKLMDFAQDLKIKGMNDEKLIYNLALAQLGDVEKELQDFEEKRNASRKRRSLKLAAGISVASIIIVTLIVFFAVSFSFEDIFAKSWLILLAGFSVALFVALLFFSIILSGKIKKLLIRLTAVSYTHLPRLKRNSGRGLNPCRYYVFISHLYKKSREYPGIF